MPTHIHLLIFVEKDLPEHLGFFISRFKYFTKLELQRKNLIGKETNVFEASFHDRILRPKHNINTVINYIRENPKRFLKIINFPDFFIKETKLIHGIQCQIYGNPLLLDNPFKETVIIHRSDAPEVLENKYENCMHLASNGGILVGAFVSKKEREILNSVLDMGAKVIYIKEKAIIEKEKVTKKLFDHCSYGNLLIIHPYEMIKYLNPKNPDKLTREGCLFMNNFAETLTK